MKHKEEEVINALISLRENFEKEEIEITTSGVFLYADIQLTTRQVAQILRRFAEEVRKDSTFNHNIYKINLNKLVEVLNNEVCNEDDGAVRTAEGR